MTLQKQYIRESNLRRQWNELKKQVSAEIIVEVNSLITYNRHLNSIEETVRYSIVRGIDETV